MKLNLTVTKKIYMKKYISKYFRKYLVPFSLGSSLIRLKPQNYRK